MVDSLQQAIDLALAGEAEAATKLYYKILESGLSDSVADRLFGDIKDILAVEEIVSYKEAADKGVWLLRFWRRVDPTPATVANERLVEHYQRLAYARKYFASPQPRGYDDRGAIYVRYGPPDDKYISGMGETTWDNESWIYHRFGDVSFDFISYGGLYWLTDDLRKAIAAPATTGLGRILQLANLFLERQDLGIRYQIVAPTLLAIAQGFGCGRTPDEVILYDYIEKNEQLKRELPEHVSEFRLKEKPLAFVAANAAFAQRRMSQMAANIFATNFNPGHEISKSPMAARLELYYALLLNKLNTKKLFNAKHPANMILAFAVYNKSHDLLLQKEDSLQLDLSAVLSQKDYISQLTFFLRPDTYRVALDIQSPQTNQRGMMQMLEAVPEFPRDRLSLSDIELASEVRAATPVDKEKGFIKNGLYVRPYPSRVIVRRQPIFVYFEIYGLFLDETGTALYRVTYEVEQKGPSGMLALLSALNPFGGKKSSLSLSYEYTGTDRDVPQYTSLDFSDLEPGEHTLVVRVEDLVSGLQEEKKVMFKLLE